MNLIISQLIGGLGNQMFQYAVGRALALPMGIPLRLDISGFDGYELHQGFELHRVFNCNATLASTDEVRSVLGWRCAPMVRRILSRPQLALLRGKAFVVEPHFHYWPGFRDILPTAYLQGYWQSSMYFADVEAVIRADFAFREPLSEINTTVVRKIDNAKAAVSLHVRRGDYVVAGRAHATHGLCSIDYYRSAVRFIADRIEEEPVFFVFSDDIAWARDNLCFDYHCHYIDHNRGSESYNDMRLMSMCHHHIIANSSFSWWGAWLNPRSDKLVVAPKKWFANKTDTKDLFPTGWVVL